MFNVITTIFCNHVKAQYFIDNSTLRVMFGLIIAELQVMVLEKIHIFTAKTNICCAIRIRVNLQSCIFSQCVCVFLRLISFTLTNLDKFAKWNFLCGYPLTSPLLKVINIGAFIEPKPLVLNAA